MLAWGTALGMGCVRKSQAVGLLQPIVYHQESR
ncbi:MAG: hypothetical protein ACI92G_002958 [Candidatus Pelagisphaera sp.]